MVKICVSKLYELCISISKGFCMFKSLSRSSVGKYVIFKTTKKQIILDCDVEQPQYEVFLFVLRNYSDSVP